VCDGQTYSSNLQPPIRVLAMWVVLYIVLPHLSAALSLTLVRRSKPAGSSE